MVKEKEICIRRADTVDTALDYVIESADRYLEEKVGESFRSLELATHWAELGKGLKSETAKDLLDDISKLRERVRERVKPEEYDEIVSGVTKKTFERMLDEYCKCLREEEREYKS